MTLETQPFMKRTLFLLLPVFFFIHDIKGQLNRYIVELKNKATTNFTIANPSAYLSARAIARRNNYQITIDSSDLPVSSVYISQIQNIPNVTILNISKWLNAVSILTTDPNAISAISALPFVKTVNAIAARPSSEVSQKFETSVSYTPPLSNRMEQMEGDFFNYGTSSFNEIHLHQGEFLHNIGLRGQGLQIAILDGGFFNYKTLSAFDSVNMNGQVISTWDFVDRQSGVVEDHPHGMMCFSTIAANIPGQFIGKAPKAGFHLFRTEDATSEYPIEEFNWACAAERADSTGADIISSSLGYGYQFNGGIPDYPKSILNGDITMSSRAADLAAKKGLMVFNAAGNSGNDYWHTILTPADGDSVIAVGAVNTIGQVGAFSAYGPSADGRIKPDVASVGVTAMVQTTGNTIGFSNGTSFACPNMAGLATCLWQGFPEFNNMRIARALKEAGSISSSPDNRIGYGIPNLRNAFTALLKDFASSSIELRGCHVTLKWTSKDVAAMKYEFERKAPGDLSFSKIAERMPNPGDVLTNHSYQFDNELISGTTGLYQYRIRQIVDTAASSFTVVYLDTLELALTNPCVSGLPPQFVIVAPNPVSTTGSIIIETANPIPQMTISIFDMKGALIWQKKQSKSAGRSSVDFPKERLMPGAYIVKVFDGENILGQDSFIRL